MTKKKTKSRRCNICGEIMQHHVEVEIGPSLEVTSKALRCQRCREWFTKDSLNVQVKTVDPRRVKAVIIEVK